MDCRICLKGYLDSSWQEWLGDLHTRHDVTGTTLLTGQLPDQAALYGALITLRRLNLTLLDLSIGELSERLMIEQILVWYVVLGWLAIRLPSHRPVVRTVIGPDEQ